MILLYSGGIDSYIAWHYLKNPRTLYFDLKTKYTKKEKKIVEKFIPKTIIDSSLQNYWKENNIVLPYRNLILASSATRYSFDVVIAGVEDDNCLDKSEASFSLMQKTLCDISKNKMSLTSPFWNLSKSEIVKWYKNNIQKSCQNLIDGVSCYSGELEEDNYCGRCESCFRKFVSLRDNGIDIEFYNSELINLYIERAKRNQYLNKRNSSILRVCLEYVPKKVFCFDIDGVITLETEGHRYERRKPNKENIEKINKLKKGGNKIILWTARKGIENDEKITKKWLRENGCLYDILIFKKFYYDEFIDDKKNIIK